MRLAVAFVAMRVLLVLAAAAAMSRACYVFPLETSDPCRDVRCRHGARCVAAPDGRSASCHCPAACPDYGDHAASRPVCGSDGRSYRNQCELRREACRRAVDIGVRFHGKCDPCESIRCAPPEVCQLDGDRTPQCRCGESCPLELTPVCASDGRTYANECSLRQQACKERRPLRVVFRGKCSPVNNPCTALECAAGEQCVVTKSGSARCECPAECEPVLRPVCGSDLRTYPSECELRRAACLARRRVIVAHAGNCGGGGPCSMKRCDHGAVCVERGGEAQCECSDCPEEFSPVCGSDGISYGNACKLRAESCRHQRRIVVLYQGLCDGCENYICSHYGVCESEGSGTVRCICPESCVDIHAPVCGTDGTTYKNECELRRSSCQLQKALSTAYKGECDLCEGVKCELGARCEKGKCTCINECSNSNYTSRFSEPVCASNARTYASECEMKYASCLQPSGSSPLSVIFYGECRERSGIEVLTTATTPSFYQSPVRQKITTISSELGMEMHENSIPIVSNEKAKKNITRSSNFIIKAGVEKDEACQDIRCDFDAVCKVGDDGFPHCECQFDCSLTPQGRPVCASDKRTYPSLCAMKMEACKKQEELRLRPMDLCQGMEVKPCNGDPPLVNPATGTDYDCGNGHFRQDCPAGSYCHQTSQFARCCRKGNVNPKSCEDSWFGCCPDGKTPAQGTDNAGCPSLCGCNKLGSLSDVCDPDTLQCKCKPGVGGIKCDRCEPGYWGLPKISEGHQGCLACGCSILGSVREDCEQMTGRCMCKAGVQGQKCTVCTGHNMVLSPSGCILSTDEILPGTERPIRRSTMHRYTEPEGGSLPLLKFTRHLLVPVVPSHKFFYQSGNSDQGLIEKNNTDIYYEGIFRPTPATIQLVIELLGDLCSTDTDCIIPNSRCVNDHCVCYDGYVETTDRQGCIAYKVPSFDGHSYVQLKRLKAYNKFSLEMEFTTYANDGIILYDQQKADGTGDFVSVSIINGHIDFRYNLGNGVVVITSLERVQLGQIHRVSIKRYHRDGVLRLDDGEDVMGQSQGSLKALDLGEDAFIGYMPTNLSKVFENIGTQKGLLGCIHMLKLGQHKLELHENRDSQVVRVEHIKECGQSPCANLPCQHGGTCSVDFDGHYKCSCTNDFTGDNCENRVNPCKSSPCVQGSICEVLPQGGFTCKCAPGHTGQTCQNVGTILLEVFIPEFDSNSYLKLPRLEGVGKAFSIEIWFLSRTLDGILFYNGQLLNGKGDFISLELVNGHVQFRYDLGSGPANITSEDEIILNKWHSAKVSRVDREGTLQLDGGVIAHGESGPPLNELNLELPLYIGGVPDNSTIGFDGAVQRLIVNGHMIEDLEGPYVVRWQGTPCSHSVCLNGGVCQPILEEYHCKCQKPYSGQFCENGHTVKNRPIKFSGHNFYSFTDKEVNVSFSFNETNFIIDETKDGTQIENDTIGEQDMYDNDEIQFFEKGLAIEYQTYEIVFRTMEPNSLLLWLENYSKDYDHFALVIVGGFLELSIGIDKKLTARSKVYVSDGVWHTVTAHQKSLQVDSESPVRIKSVFTEPLFGIKKFWIGGADNLPKGLPEPYYKGFSGCIEDMKVSRKQLNLVDGISENEIIEYCDENDV